LPGVELDAGELGAAGEPGFPDDAGAVDGAGAAEAALLCPKTADTMLPKMLILASSSDFLSTHSLVDAAG
jgi:hypothetical protein